MELRWCNTIDEFGNRSEPELQYWDEESEKWEVVPFEEIKIESKKSPGRFQHNSKD